MAGPARQRDDFAQPHPVGLVVEAGPRVLDGLDVLLLDDPLPRVLARHDPIGAVRLSVPDGGDDLLPPASSQHFVGVLEREVGDLGLAGGQQFGTLDRSLLPRLVHIQHEDDGLVALQPVKAVSDRSRRPGRTGWQRHDRPLVVLDLRDRHAVDLALGHDDHLAARGPEVHAPERQGTPGALQVELLVCGLKFLRQDFSGGVPVRSDLTLTVPPVVKQAAGLFIETTGLQFAVRNVGEWLRLLDSISHGNLLIRVGVFVVLTAKAIRVAVRVTC